MARICTRSERSPAYFFTWFLLAATWPGRTRQMIVQGYGSHFGGCVCLCADPLKLKFGLLFGLGGICRFEWVGAICLLVLFTNTDGVDVYD